MVVQPENQRNIGKVKWFDDKIGYGFIEWDGPDMFVHWTEIIMEGRKTLLKDQIVVFDVGPGKRGDEAKKVVVSEVKYEQFKANS